MVTEIRADGVDFKDGTSIASETVVWTAGIQGDPVVAEWGIEVGSAGRVTVEPTLQVPGHPEIFVAGDLSAARDEGGELLPQVAPVAVQQGEYLSDAVRMFLAGDEIPPFRYKDPGMLAVVGRSHAVAQVFGGAFTGFVAWVLWALIHVAKLVGFRNRVLVLVNWAWNYIFYKRAVRLILPVAGGEEEFVEEIAVTPSGGGTGSEPEVGDASG